MSRWFIRSVSTAAIPAGLAAGTAQAQSAVPNVLPAPNAEASASPFQVAQHAAPAQAALVDPWEHLDLSGSLADVSNRFASEAERRKIAQALKQAGGDKGRAADLLQVNFKALAAKMRQHGLD